MKTSALTIDGSPVVSEYKRRKMRRRRADVDAYEAKQAHRLTLNALIAAICMIEEGQRSVELLQALKESARRAEVAA